MQTTETIQELEVKNTLKTWALNVLFYIVVYIPMVLLNAWCLTTIWNMWVPLVYNFTLTTLQAVAISVIVSWFRASYVESNTEPFTTKSYWTKQLGTVVGRLIYVGISSLLYTILVRLL